MIKKISFFIFNSYLNKIYKNKFKIDLYFKYSFKWFNHICKNHEFRTLIRVKSNCLKNRLFIYLFTKNVSEVDLE